ncbi:MAG: transporter [Hyphomicrobium sp.]
MSISMRGFCAVGAAACLIHSTTDAFAHHAGGLGNTGSGGPIVTISAATLDEGHSVAGISVIYSDFSHLSDDTLISATASGNEGVHGLSTIQSYALTYAYGWTNDLTVGFRLPYIRRTGIRAAEENDEVPPEIEVEDHGPSDGIGDLSLFAEYRFLNDRETNTQAALIVSLQTPTGKTNVLTRQGDLQDAEFQPGSGAWDPLFGLAVTHTVGPWSFDANALYNLVTTGTQDTDLGDQFLYNFAVSYRLTGVSSTGAMFHGAHAHEPGDDGHGHHHDANSGPALDLVLELNGEWHAKQDTAGVVDENSGGHTIFIAPGLRLSQGNVSGYASIGIPVLADENGIQPEPEWRLITGVSIAFE